MKCPCICGLFLFACLVLVFVFSLEIYSQVGNRKIPIMLNPHSYSSGKCSQILKIPQSLLKWVERMKMSARKGIRTSEGLRGSCTCPHPKTIEMLMKKHLISLQKHEFLRCSSGGKGSESGVCILTCTLDESQALLEIGLPSSLMTPCSVVGPLLCGHQKTNTEGAPVLRRGR